MAVQTPKRSPLFPSSGSGSRRCPAYHRRVVEATILAHQGGWDEALVVAIPIVVFAWILWMANRRAARLQQERDGGTPPVSPPD